MSVGVLSMLIERGEAHRVPGTNAFSSASRAPQATAAANDQLSYRREQTGEVTGAAMLTQASYRIESTSGWPPVPMAISTTCLCVDIAATEPTRRLSPRSVHRRDQNHRREGSGGPAFDATQCNRRYRSCCTSPIEFGCSAMGRTSMPSSRAGCGAGIVMAEWVSRCVLSRPTVSFTS